MSASPACCLPMPTAAASSLTCMHSTNTGGECGRMVVHCMWLLTGLWLLGRYAFIALTKYLQAQVCTFHAPPCTPMHDRIRCRRHNLSHNRLSFERGVISACCASSEHLGSKRAHRRPCQWHQRGPQLPFHLPLGSGFRSPASRFFFRSHQLFNHSLLFNRSPQGIPASSVHVHAGV